MSSSEISVFVGLRTFVVITLPAIAAVTQLRHLRRANELDGPLSVVNRGWIVWTLKHAWMSRGACSRRRCPTRSIGAVCSREPSKEETIHGCNLPTPMNGWERWYAGSSFPKLPSWICMRPAYSPPGKPSNRSVATDVWAEADGRVLKGG